MTHPTDPVAAMREACAKACENHGVTSDQVADLWWDGYRDGREDAARAVRALPLPAAPAPIATPADDAVARATERVVKAWTRMDTPGAECDLHDAVEALYEAWTDAAERAASDEKGG